MNKLAEQLLEVGKWPQVALLVGSRTSNKQELALQVMRHLVCQHPTTEACISCPVELSTHPDVYSVSPLEEESLISLTAIKEGIKHIYQSPLLSSKKILYVQAAELLSIEAANALLKPIEDYHPNRHIFLLTTAAEHILPTIRSRAVLLNCLVSNLPTGETPTSAIQKDLQLLPQAIVDGSVDRYQLIERLHTSLAKLANVELRLLLTEEAAKWQTVFLRAHQTSGQQHKKQQLRSLAEQCEQIPTLIQQHVSLKSILETLITTL